MKDADFDNLEDIASLLRNAALLSHAIHLVLIAKFKMVKSPARHHCHAIQRGFSNIRPLLPWRRDEY